MSKLIAYCVKLNDSNYYTVYQESLEHVASDIKKRLDRPNPLGAEGSKTRGSKVKFEWIAKCQVLKDGDHPKTTRPQDLSLEETIRFRNLMGDTLKV